MIEAQARDPRKIRVLRVFSRLNIGGPAIHVILATRYLDPERYDSLLVVGREEDHEGNLLDLARSRNTPLVFLPRLRRSVHPYRDALALVQLFRLIRSHRPDIVHTHTAKAGALGRLAARIAGVPAVVHTFHGSVFQGYFGRLGSRACESAERALARLTDVLVAVSPKVASDLTARGIVPRRRIDVIPLGLELEPFDDVEPFRGELRSELGISPRTPLAGAVGRLVPIKDIPTLLDAMKHLSRWLPQARLVLVGDGPERSFLERRATELGLAGRVHFLGFRSDLARIYADLDLVVNCSLNEGTPVALIEAMTCGVPVVATRVGGTPDLLENGRLGALVPASSPEALADAMTEVLVRISQPPPRVAEARARMKVRFRRERLLDDLDRLYASLVSHPVSTAASASVRQS